MSRKQMQHYLTLKRQHVTADYLFVVTDIKHSNTCSPPVTKTETKLHF